MPRGIPKKVRRKQRRKPQPKYVPTEEGLEAALGKAATIREVAYLRLAATVTEAVRIGNVTLHNLTDLLSQFGDRGEQ